MAVFFLIAFSINFGISGPPPALISRNRVLEIRREEAVISRENVVLSLLQLKSDSHLPKHFFISFNESPLKMMKNAFYFILKALFILKIFKFLL